VYYAVREAKTTQDVLGPASSGLIAAKRSKITSPVGREFAELISSRQDDGRP
jgi:hypothetical protein